MDIMHTPTSQQLHVLILATTRTRVVCILTLEYTYQLVVVVLLLQLVCILQSRVCILLQQYYYSRSSRSTTRVSIFILCILLASSTTSSYYYQLEYAQIVVRVQYAYQTGSKYSPTLHTLLKQQYILQSSIRTTLVQQEQNVSNTTSQSCCCCWYAYQSTVCIFIFSRPTTLVLVVSICDRTGVFIFIHSARDREIPQLVQQKCVEAGTFVILTKVRGGWAGAFSLQHCSQRG